LVDRDYFEEKSLYNLILKPIFCTFPGRGMIRKAILPFLLGLKLKTTVLVPLALGLIALKTWKAMTLGLLSLVLSGALVIFTFTSFKNKDKNSLRWTFVNMAFLCLFRCWH